METLASVVSESRQVEGTNTKSVLIIAVSREYLFYLDILIMVTCLSRGEWLY